VPPSLSNGPSPPWPRPGGMEGRAGSTATAEFNI